MKKVKVLALSAGILLCASFASAQDIEFTPMDDDTNPIDFSIIARYDLNPYFSFDKTSDDRVEFDWRALNVYTLFEGQPTKWFSYSMCNHWVAPDITGLYKCEDGANLFYTNGLNWMDWANVTFTVGAGSNWGSLGFTAGKQTVMTGGFEVDQYDFEAFAELSSYFWNEFSLYQWGAAMTYTLPSENTSLAFQFTTSPFGSRIGCNLFTYNLQWRGDYDWYSPIWSVNFLQVNKKWDVDAPRFMNIISLGNEFYVGDFTIGVEYMNRATSVKKFFAQDFSVLGCLKYNWEDTIEVVARGGYDYIHNEYDWLYRCPRTMAEDSWFAGFVFNYYPLSDRSLRLHAGLAYNTYMYTDYLSFNVGALYNFNLTSVIRR